MAKNIVFCADGTWKGLGHSQGDGDELQADATNVLRLFAALAGAVTPDPLRKQDEQEKVALGPDGGATQVAKYLHGVGDSGNAIRKILGGVFGEGFIERHRARLHLRVPQLPARRPHLPGRLQPRSLHGARPGRHDRARWACCRRTRCARTTAATTPPRPMASASMLWAEYRRRAGKASTLLGYLEEFKSRRIDPARLVQGVGIEAIGVWDTVGSLGVPLYRPGRRGRRSTSSSSPTGRCRRRCAAASMPSPSTSSGAISN